MTTSCSNCKRYISLVPEGSTLRAVDFEADGFTPSAAHHVCGEFDRSAY